jgi:hypothetical protein
MSIYSGHRVYDGCPDSELKRRVDSEAARLAELRRSEPEAHATYFPVEGCWMIHVWGRPLSDMYHSRAEALDAALRSQRGQ